MAKVVNRRVTIEQSQTGFKAKIWNTNEMHSLHSDSAFADGVFAVPITKEEPRYNIRALDKYCSELGVSPTDLSKEQLAKFEIHSR